MRKKIKSKERSPNTPSTRTFGSVRGSASRKELLVKCAFCRGTGLDRFGVPSKLSQCQTCKGRGKVYVPEPHEKCASCLGTGVFRHHRLTCFVCGGRGRVRKLSRTRGEGCLPRRIPKGFVRGEKENEEALHVHTGLPCFDAYELGKTK